MDLLLIFLTGLTVGGLTCLAVQGGLLASVIASRKGMSAKELSGKDSLLQTGVFLTAKFVVYILFGFFLGLFGMKIGISPQVQGVVQLFAGVYMIGIACNLLNVHPIFRYFVIQPPRFIFKIIKKQSRSAAFFAPAFLGAMTVFIPCGTTLAMEALAISSGNPMKGAAIMGAFILGTTPLFMGLGFMTTFFGERFNTFFYKIAAVILLYLGFTAIHGALITQGIAIPPKFEQKEKLYSEAPVSQDVTITITSDGYSPNTFRVKSGTPVRLQLLSKDAYSCASAFRIPSLGFSKNLGPNETYTYFFTPQKKGEISFTCSMGMYSGVIEVL